MTADDDARPPHIDKGKRRALEPSERTPLLGSSSHQANDGENVNTPESRRHLRKVLTTVFLVSLSGCIVACILLALFAWSYASRASHLTPEDIVNHHLVFTGPDQVQVLNVTKEGVWLQVSGKMGLDAGSAIDVNSDPNDGVLREIWKAIGRWSVRTLDKVSVNMSTVAITPEYGIEPLLYLDIAPLEVPLSVDPPSNMSWLTAVSTPVRVRLTSNSNYVLTFLKESWRSGSLSVVAQVGEVRVRGGDLGRTTWRSTFHGKLSNIRTSIHIKIPAIPGLPRYPPFPPISDLITLKSFNVSSDPNNLNLAATASILTPITVSLSAPSLPFLISLPSLATPLASVSSAATQLTYPNTTLSVQGHILPIPSETLPLLATFLARYLSGLPSDIVVSTPFLPGYDVAASFPAPYPRPQILRDVTIKDMKIRPAGTLFVASGIVLGRIVLPAGMHISLDVAYVLPDVLVFDGEVPPLPEPGHLYEAEQGWEGARGLRGATPELPDEPPLPDPLPDRAFAHIRPDEWLPAVSVPAEPEEGAGAVYAISARVVDVPLQVLPGRQKGFSNFVGKVIFGSDGATAGLLGSAAVTVTVEGLPLSTPGRKDGEISLSGLPLQGSVHIKKH